MTTPDPQWRQDEPDKPLSTFVVMKPSEAIHCTNAALYVVESDDAFWPNYLVDTRSNEIVFCDQMEPEDVTLLRDLAQVVYLLNREAENVDAALEGQQNPHEKVEKDG